MKRCLLILTVLVIPASAQWRHFGGPRLQEVQPTGYFGVGFSQPVNPLAKGLNTGFSLAGGVGITRPYVGVMFDGMFSDFGMNSAALAQAGAKHGSERFWGFTVDPIFHVNQRGPVDFYVTGGGGVYGENTKLRTTIVNQQNNTFDAISSETRTGPGVDGGAGFAFNLSNRSRAKIFLEARYHHMFLQGPDADFIPVTVGVRF